MRGRFERLYLRRLSGLVGERFEFLLLLQKVEGVIDEKLLTNKILYSKITS